jgi:hypothetical protein
MAGTATGAFEQAAALTARRRAPADERRDGGDDEAEAEAGDRVDDLRGTKNARKANGRKQTNPPIQKGKARPRRLSAAAERLDPSHNRGSPRQLRLPAYRDCASRAAPAGYSQGTHREDPHFLRERVHAERDRREDAADQHLVRTGAAALAVVNSDRWFASQLLLGNGRLPARFCCYVR